MVMAENPAAFALFYEKSNRKFAANWTSTNIEEEEEDGAEEKGAEEEEAATFAPTIVSSYMVRSC